MMFTENHHNRLIRSLVILAFVASGFLLVQAIAGIKGLDFIGNDGIPESTISVSGDGEVFVVPDIATFTFSVAEEAITVIEAQQAVSRKIDAALAFLADNSIEDRDIKTTDYSIYPRYEYPNIRCFAFPCPEGERTLAGYNVSQTILVKVRIVDKAGTLLGGMGEIGVTNVSGLAFAVDDENALVREARQKAIDDAKEKAKELARDLDVRLRRIVSFYEDSGIPFYARAAAFEGKGGDGVIPPSPEVPAGENKITSHVTLVYEIR